MDRNIERQFQTYTLPPLAGENKIRRLLCICHEYQNLMCCFLFATGVSQTLLHRIIHEILASTREDTVSQ